MKVTPIAFLLTTTFLTTSAFANTTSDVDVDYLEDLTSPDITWENVSSSGNGVIKIGGSYYKYTYNKPSNYTYTSTRINDTLSTANVTNMVFKNITNSYDGGAIYNTKNNSNINILSDFIGNSSRAGGAIYNGSSAIGNVTGNFIGNYVSTYSSYGGAIHNYYNGTIGDITGDFVGNYVSSGNYASGGAILNYGTIGDIAGNFIGNYVYSSGSYGETRGGAFYNTGTIGNVTGSFIGNYVSVGGANAYGGAIYNGYGSIRDITGDFMNNYVSSTSGSAYGGAIYNYSGTIGDITGSFIGNHVSSTSGSAYGGAIYNRGKITISADNSTSIIKDNYVEDKNGRRAEAIYVAKDSTLTLKANNKGAIEVYDIINGVVGYDVKLTGDGTGSVSLFNDITNADIIANNVDVILANGTTKDYSINSLTSDYTVGWSIDLDVSNREADKIITSNASSGTVVIDNLNIIGSISDIAQNQTTNPFVVQILNTQDNNLQLSLSDTIETQLNEYIIGYVDAAKTAETISSVSDWSKIYQYTVTSAGTIYGKLGLATTKTTNDSIGLVESRRDVSTTYDSMGDTLKLVAEANIGDRSFVTDDATADHTLSEDIDTVASGKLDIIGATSEVDKSSIDMNDKQGFNLTNATVLTFKDVAVSNAKDDNLVNVSNSNAKVNIDNANIDGNINGSVEYAMSITGTSNINGNISNADVTATDAVLSFGENTFASSKLTTIGGSVNLNDSETRDYTIDSLSAGNTTNWSIDFDVSSRTADKIVTNNGSSGTVVVDNLNIINGTIADISSEQVGTEFIVQVLDTQNDDLQLDLSDYVKSQLGNEKYVIGRQTDYFDDGVQEMTHWSDIYNRYSQLSEMFGKLGLATTETENDSIGITYYETIVHDKELVGSLGDTLSLVSAANIDGREFNSTSADEEYVLTADLDTVAGGKFAINGQIDGEKRSTINMNDKRGFNIGNATELSFNNVAIKDASSYLVNINNADAVVNMTNVDVTNANISGSGQLNIAANGATSNFDDSIVTWTGGALNLEASNGGLLTFNDAITVLDNDINVSGDNSGEIKLNDNVITTGNFGLSNGAIVGFGLNSKLNAKNMVSKGGVLKFDVKANLTSNKIELATLTVNKELSGSYGVIINSLNQDQFERAEDVKTPFLYALNDTDSGNENFDVLRVIGSPYLWDAVQNVNGETKGSTWYFTLQEQENQFGQIRVVPEVMATVAVKTAGLSQTNGMVYNIMRKVGVNRLFCPGCGFYDYNWDGEAFHNVWVDTTYNGLTIEAPVEIEANVWGIEAGSDLQHDLNNKLGIFVSYRQGNYEMDGKGEKYYSTIGSELDIDSYLAGLYYRYDKNNWYTFATIYGGMQNAEIQTNDGVSADTDGIEFGGSIEAGYNYALTRKLSVTPSLGAFYSQISYDEATDSVGKTVNYNDLKQVELEAGAKFAYTQYTDNGFYSLYVKPSAVQTLVDGDEIEITGRGKVDTVEDKTLGRVELGGNIGFNDNWSAYGWANYTLGSDYEATSLGIGLSYAW